MVSRYRGALRARPVVLVEERHRAGNGGRAEQPQRADGCNEDCDPVARSKGSGARLSACCFRLANVLTASGHHES